MEEAEGGERVLRLRSYLVVAAAILGTMFLFYTLAVYNVINAQGRAFVIFTDLALIVASLVAVLAVASVPARFDKGTPSRRFWSLVEMALVLALAAYCSWFVYEGILGRNIPSPFVADYLWVAAYAFLAVAIVGMLVGYRKLGLTLDWPKSWWMIPFLLGVVVLLIFFVVRPVLTSPTASWADKIYNPAYAFFDLVIVAPALMLTLTLGKGSASKPFRCISLALGMFGLAEIPYIWLHWNGLYRAGNYLEILFAAGYLLAGLAGVYQSELTAARSHHTLFRPTGGHSKDIPAA